MNDDRKQTSDMEENIHRLKKKVSWLLLLNGVLIGCAIVLYVRCSKIDRTLELITENTGLIYEFDRLVVLKLDCINELLEFIKEFLLKLD